MDFGSVTTDPLAQLLVAIEQATKESEADEAASAQEEEAEWNNVEPAGRQGHRGAKGARQGQVGHAAAQ